MLSTHVNGPSIDTDTGMIFDPSAQQLGSACVSLTLPILSKFIDA